MYFIWNANPIGPDMGCTPTISLVISSGNVLPIIGIRTLLKLTGAFGFATGRASATFGATIKPMRLLKNDLRLFMENGAGGQIRTDDGITPASLQN